MLEFMGYSKILEEQVERIIAEAYPSKPTISRIEAQRLLLRTADKLAGQSKYSIMKKCCNVGVSQNLDPNKNYYSKVMDDEKFIDNWEQGISDRQAFLHINPMNYYQKVDDYFDNQTEFISIVNDYIGEINNTLNSYGYHVNLVEGIYKIAYWVELEEGAGECFIMMNAREFDAMSDQEQDEYVHKVVDRYIDNLEDHDNSQSVASTKKSWNSIKKLFTPHRLKIVRSESGYSLQIISNEKLSKSDAAKLKKFINMINPLTWLKVWAHDMKYVYDRFA